MYLTCLSHGHATCLQFLRWFQPSGTHTMSQTAKSSPIFQLKNSSNVCFKPVSGSFQRFSKKMEKGVSSCNNPLSGLISTLLKMVSLLSTQSRTKIRLACHEKRPPVFPASRGGRALKSHQSGVVPMWVPVWNRHNRNHSSMVHKMEVQKKNWIISSSYIMIPTSILNFSWALEKDLVYLDFGVTFSEPAILLHFLSPPAQSSDQTQPATHSTLRVIVSGGMFKIAFPPNGPKNQKKTMRSYLK